MVAYSPLVKYVAGRMSSGLPAHVEESDLISYGLGGLISAIERFDLTREIKFETYAITRIRGAIIDELRTLDWVPRSVRAKAREIERANMKLEGRFQRAPTDEEMATELELSVDDFQEALVQISNSTIVALDELWSVSDATGDSISLLDTRPDRGAPDPQQLVDQSELRDRIADAIAALPEREKLVVALYYYENLTLREIGETLGVTESRVCQLHTKAVLRLRSSSPASWSRFLGRAFRPGILRTMSRSAQKARHGCRAPSPRRRLCRASMPGGPISPNSISRPAAFGQYPRPARLSPKAIARGIRVGRYAATANPTFTNGYLRFFGVPAQPRERSKACTSQRIASAMWHSSATAVVARPLCTRRFCSRQVSSTGLDRSSTGPLSLTPIPMRRPARCRSRQRCRRSSGRSARST